MFKELIQHDLQWFKATSHFTVICVPIMSQIMSISKRWCVVVPQIAMTNGSPCVAPSWDLIIVLSMEKSNESYKSFWLL